MTDTEAVTGLDEYIRNLSWSVGTTEHAKTLVAGNLRNFWVNFCLPRVLLMVAAETACMHPDCGKPRAYCHEHSLAERDIEPGFFGRAAARLQRERGSMLEDIHKAWLALADSDIEEAERLLIKWVKVTS